MAINPKDMPTLHRSLPVRELAFTNGELEAILVPWDTAVDVADVTPSGDVDAYREGFLRTAFDRQLADHPKSVADVTLLPRHGSSETFGRLLRATKAEAGLHGVVGVLPSRRDDVASMVEQGVDSMSIEFTPLERRPRMDGTPDGVRWRAHAFLTAVAMTPQPAYEDAKVLALRDQQTAELEKIERDDEARRRAIMDEIDAELESLRARAEKWR